MKKKHFVPLEATSVGEHLKDELIARGIKQKDFSKKTGIKESALSEIINGKRGIDVKKAFLFFDAFGIHPLYWLNLQARYEFNLEMIKRKDK